MDIQPEQLLAQVSELLRTMPEIEGMQGVSLSTSEWLGRVSAVLKLWNPITANMQVSSFIQQINTNSAIHIKTAYRGLATLLNEAKYDLGLKTGQLAVAIDGGKFFDYFDQVRKIIETGQSDIFFVDPYLDADFISRYMPHIKKSATVRLLGSKHITALRSAANIFKQQESLNIEVRSSPNHHDRFIFIDRKSCYLSSASFKDGASKPTILAKLTDVFSNVSSVYEDMWTNGNSVP